MDIKAALHLAKRGRKVSLFNDIFAVQTPRMNRIPFIFFLICSALLHAQSPLVETISIEHGLSQGFVPAICQDDDGFLWVGTKNGLNRYDGYQFQVFKNDPFDSLTLSNNEIIAFHMLGDFLVLMNNGLQIQLLHRKTQRFYSLWSTTKFGYLQKFFPIGKNTIGLLGIQDQTVCLYKAYWPEDIIKQIEKGAKPADLVQLELVEKRPDMLDAEIAPDGKKIWIYTGKQLLVRDLQSGKTQQLNVPVFRSTPSMSIPLRGKIIFDPAGAICVFQQNEVARFDGHKWSLHTLPFSQVEFFYTDHKNGYLWLLTGHTLYGVDFREQSSEVKPAWELPFDQPLTAIHVDQYGNVWMGTNAHGIRKFSLRTGTFRNYFKGFSIYCQPVFNEKKHVLMGDVRRNQFFFKLLDLDRGQEVPLSSLGVPNAMIRQKVITENGLFWMTDGRWPKQLTCLDPEKGIQQSFAVPSDFKVVLPVLRYDERGEIWIITATQMARFDMASRRFSIFNNPDQLSEMETIAAERDATGTWWIGTDNGLYKAEPETGASGETFRFSKMRVEKGKRNSLLTNSIKSLLIDPDDPNILWIGTNGQGMSRLDIDKNQFTHYTTKEGLPDDVVYGILADDENPHNLWLSTNRGLARFNPATELFQYFFKSDGLQDNEFNTFASYKSRSGKLFFGGVNGLTVFNPKDLRIENIPPKVHLTGLKINGEDVKPHDAATAIDKDIAFLERLELPFSKNNLVFQFAAMDYTKPQRNQFAYYLEGAEEEWAHRGFEHSAQYLNLSPGTYTFRVKAANSSGVWNEQPIALIVVIHAPWYRTGWAYLVYVLLLAGTVFLIYKNQLRRKLEQAEAKRLKGLDEFKTRFFTNITHEFRTPLTVILGITERLTAANGSLPVGEEGLAKHDSQNSLGLIKRSGENLLRLINQILDLAKLESNALKMNFVQGDMLPYLRYISESLHSLASVKNITLQVESSETEIVMDYDPERLLQIVHNLLSNAIKFTPPDGKIWLRVAITADHWLHLTVEDSGVGIPAEELPLLFDRFFQAKNQEHTKAGGTGIGLSLTRELVRALNGEISAASPVPGSDQGTIFTIKLPMANKAPKSEAILPAPTPQIAEPSNLQDLSQAKSEIPKASKLAADEERSPQILLIEDNPDVMHYLAACLQTQYALDFAYDGQAGIEKALETIPDLIISDVMMPEKDGFQVCDFLKNDERTSHIPIILLTAKADVENRIAGLKRGADAYLSKPFHEAELLVWIQQLIARRRILQARYSNLTAELPALKPSETQEELVLEDAFIQKFKTILEDHYTEPDLTVEHFCRKMGVSRAQLYRKLAALTNRSLTEHLNAYRLDKAYRQLLAGGMTVSEVAFNVGYNDPKYFGRLFAETYGSPPSTFLPKS